MVWRSAGLSQGLDNILARLGRPKIQQTRTLRSFFPLCWHCPGRVLCLRKCHIVSGRRPPLHSRSLCFTRSFLPPLLYHARIYNVELQVDSVTKLCWGVLGVAAFSQQPSRHTQVVPGLMSSLQTENRDRPWLRDAPLGPPNLSLGPRSSFTEGCIKDFQRSILAAYSFPSPKMRHFMTF